MSFPRSKVEARLLPMPRSADRKPRFRVGFPILCLAFRDNHHAAVTIPAGKVFEVVGPAHDDRFVVVQIDGEQFLVFGSDLEDCGKPIPDAKVLRSARRRAS